MISKVSLLGALLAWAGISQGDKLVPGHKCPSGTEPITSSWKACKVAAEALGYKGDSVAHVNYMATSVFSAWDGKRPRGCFRSTGNRRFHFNVGRGGASLDGDSILCKPTPPNHVVVPGHECPAGSEPVTENWKACETAAKSLGYSGDSVAHVAYMATSVFSAWDKKRPRGCFRSRGNDRFHFNKGRGGASLDGDRILCKRTPVAGEEKCHEAVFIDIKDNSWSEVTWSGSITGSIYVVQTTISGKWGVWGKDGKAMVQVKVGGKWEYVPGHAESGTAYRASPLKTLIVTSSESISGLRLKTPTWHTKNSRGKIRVCGAIPTARPTPKPTPNPTPKPTLKPTNIPTPKPTRSPTTARPTPNPTPMPTPEPTPAPTTSNPTVMPSFMPTFSPTLSPSTLNPSPLPTSTPSSSPTPSPTTAKPTVMPSFRPTTGPTAAPSTANPTSMPSYMPTLSPTFSPTTENPTTSPTISPTDTPIDYKLVPGHVCPAGSAPLTTSWQACEAAAKSLGYSGDSVAHVEYMATSVFSAWDGKRPRGCFRSTGNRRFHFNVGRGGSSLDGDSILCMSTSQTTTPQPTASPTFAPTLKPESDDASLSRDILVPGHVCPAGTKPLTASWQACKAAAVALGYSGDAVAHVDYMATSVFSAWDGKRPRGCFRSTGNGRFHFNVGRGGASLDGDSILCTAAPAFTSLPAPLPSTSPTSAPTPLENEATPSLYTLIPGHRCPAGMAPLTASWQACKAAAESLGYSGDSVAHVDYMAKAVFSAWDKKRPRGCFRSTGNMRFHFNVGRGGASLEGDSILCEPRTTGSPTFAPTLKPKSDLTPFRDYVEFKDWCEVVGQFKGECRGMGSKYKKGNCHCPSSPKRIRCKKLDPSYCVMAKCTKIKILDGEVTRCAGKSLLE